MSPMQSPLPTINRFITTHDSDGKAIFSNALQPENPTVPNPDSIAFALSYTTRGFPVSLEDDRDVGTYQSFLQDAPGLVVSNGTVLRHVDIPPDTSCKMHRTVSLDYGILLEGVVEAVLDSGEVRTMKRGDVCIQRGTMHAWRNPSETEWVRMVFVLQPCEPVTVNGKLLVEELAEMPGVRSSD